MAVTSYHEGYACLSSFFLSPSTDGMSSLSSIQAVKKFSIDSLLLAGLP